MQICRYELLFQKGVVIGVSYVEQALAVQIRLKKENVLMVDWQSFNALSELWSFFPQKTLLRTPNSLKFKPT